MRKLYKPLHGEISLNPEILADHTGFFTLNENLRCNFSSKDFPLGILILPFRIDLEHEINEKDNYEHELCEYLAIIFWPEL